MGQGDPGRQHQAAGMKSRLKIGKTFHNVHSANGACDHRPPELISVYSAVALLGGAQRR
jgi:hypothetical protein